MAVRISIKAIIIEQECVLAIKKVDPHGVYYLLPGGGQEFGESVTAALHRECMEEASTQVEIGPLLFVRDYIGKNHEFAREDRDFHQVELMFLCTRLPLEAGQEAIVGGVPDIGQVGVEWIPLKSISDYRLYPRALHPHLVALIDQIPQQARYLGDTN